MTITGSCLGGIALVVGFNRGMGPQAAFSITEAGARTVVFADPDEKSAQAAAEDAKLYATNPDFESVHFIVDICDERSVAEMVDFVVDRFGRIDYAVNASGTNTGRNGTRDIGRGAIVNIASANVFVGLSGKGSYAMSKHAAMGLTKMVGMWFNLILLASSLHPL
ncbi:hypothetical protein BJX66DRAFT_322278 [Aspergillus keveii]|uniref:Uncharacterized protein n=1 Tax=Aspergillus keveii TaxID=714993 RepID=A0ABR4GK44_9EURO